MLHKLEWGEEPPDAEDEDVWGPIRGEDELESGHFGEVEID